MRDGDGDDLTAALHVLQLQSVVTTSSVILSSNKIQNGDILVPANQANAVFFPDPQPLEGKCRLLGETVE